MCITENELQQTVSEMIEEQKNTIEELKPIVQKSTRKEIHALFREITIRIEKLENDS